MRVAVIGAGGTGGYFGGLLARAGHDVTFVARGAHLDAIRSHGLAVKSRLAGDFSVQAAATDDIRTIGPVDLVLVCVKAYSMDEILPALPSLIGPHTMVFSVQNGIDNEARLAAAVGERPVLGAVAQVSSFIEAPGVVGQVAGPGALILGELSGGRSERADRLRDVFRSAGIAADVRPDISVALWEKYVTICGLSGVTAVTRLPIGPVLATPETKALLRAAMAEVTAVARAGSVAVAEDFAEEGLGIMARLEPWMRGSMAQDLAEGRRLELETLNGTVVRLGRAREIPTPVNWVIYAALLPFVNGPPSVS